MEGHNCLVKGKWTLTGSLNGARGGHTLTRLLKSQVLTAGGRVQGNISARKHRALYVIAQYADAVKRPIDAVVSSNKPVRGWPATRN